MNVVRIIARRIPWPSLNEQSNRAGLRLRWNAFAESGELLVSATEHPLQDAAHMLLTLHCLPGNTPVTLRHEGKAYDSFIPMPLHIAAAAGTKRAAERAEMAVKRPSLRKHSPDAAQDGPICPRGGKAAVLPMLEGGAQ